MKFVRVEQNPIVIPNPENEWEATGAFNGCVVLVDGVYHMVYRAQSAKKQQNGVEMEVSSIGYAKSTDGVRFTDFKQLVAPTEDWEIYGCEDPRITYMDGKFYIFYTALSVYPFSAYGIKLAIAITTDFENIEKHPVTTFNSKAMGLFPEKIQGKFAALLTINTDIPPSKIALATFDSEEEMRSPYYWTEWYENVNEHMIHLMRDVVDQVELGAPPIKTDKGWLVIYSYIKNYTSDKKEFGIEAVLLDLEDPLKVLGRTESSLLNPEAEYELKGNIGNIVFPSGALINHDELYLYYGAADTSVALAKGNLGELLNELKLPQDVQSLVAKPEERKFTRFEGNPIIKPTLELDWQAMGTYNPAAIFEDGKVHILYRAQAFNGTSYIGYASSKDGLHIDENLDYPIYTPTEDFEKRIKDQGNSGCEDPRITKIDDRYYVTYTAYDGVNPPRIAMISISVDDFLNKRWNWSKAKLISPPGVDDKDSCIVKKVDTDGYFAFHRLGNAIWLDFLRDLEFPESKLLTGGIMAQARRDHWDNVKIGIGPPPIETEHGWILIYHGVSEPGFRYMMGAMLLDLHDPRKIIARTQDPLLEPVEEYELHGLVPNVVFANGVVVIDGTIFLYYGGADSVLGVATMKLDTLIDVLKNS